MKTSHQPSEHVVAEILSRFPRERTELLPALDELNGQLGYLPREAIESAARHFRLPTMAGHRPGDVLLDVERRREAAEAVQLCDDGPCHATGAADVRRALEKAAIRSTHQLHRPMWLRPGGNDRHSTLPLGHAGQRPRHPGGEEPKPFSLADEIVGIEMDDLSHSLMRNIGKINPESLDQTPSTSGMYQALKKALAMTPEQVVNEIVNSGLQGRGGAGFPAGLKMRFTAGGAKTTGGIAYVVCNADESEPGTFKDRILIEGDPHQLLEGMAIAGYAIGAHEGYIYIRGEYVEQARLCNTRSRRQKKPATWVKYSGQRVQFPHPSASRRGRVHLRRRNRADRKPGGQARRASPAPSLPHD